MNGACPNRKHPRLKGYDYSRAGVYFLTLCTAGKRCILSTVVGRGILDAPLLRLTPQGECVQKTLDYLNGHWDGLTVEASVIMPNHIHLLVALHGGAEGASGKPRPTEMRIPQFVSSLKRFTNRETGEKLWQTSYHDHVIRDDNDFLEHWNYLVSNPARWAEDIYYL